MVALLLGGLLAAYYLTVELLIPLTRIAAVAEHWRRDGAQSSAASAPVQERRAGSFKRMAQDVETQLSALQHQVHHDPLTGLPNRARFKEAVNVALSKPSEPGDSVAVMFVDLDNFKVINDSLGHAAGDELLVAVAERIRASVRGQDIPARVGGDEFTILMPGVESLETATMVADRLTEHLKAPFKLEGQEVFVTASIGIALGSPGRDRPQTLLRDADLALYRAKSSGKACYEIYDASLMDDVTARLKLETDLRRALEGGQFRLAYQPIVSLEDWRVDAVEALLRWEHPERGLVPAGEFISLAEETGLIVPIGRWMLGEACRQMQVWRAQFGAGVPTLNVNLSTRELQSLRMVEDIEGILRRTGYPASRLNVEITESAVLKYSEANLDLLRRLRQMGIKLVLDDFGAGYCALSYLNQFPIDAIKIDRIFIQRIGLTERDRMILKGLVGLAKTLRLSVVAEGIETAEQVEHLRSLECEFGQGYYCARPLKGSELRSTVLQC